jgi:hypothetical protein
LKKTSLPIHGNLKFFLFHQEANPKELKMEIYKLIEKAKPENLGIILKVLRALTILKSAWQDKSKADATPS